MAGHSMKLGVGLYLIPLAFIANPALIQTIDHPLLAMTAFFKIGLGLWLLSQGIIGGRLSKWMQVPFILLGLITIFACGIGFVQKKMQHYEFFIVLVSGQIHPTPNQCAR